VKIVYFSDNYTWGVMGTKRSIFEEMKRRGHDILWYDKKKITNILKIEQQHKPEQIWLAHSGLQLPSSVKKQIKATVVGFGFSDPYYFKPTRLNSYDMYVTNNWKIQQQYKNFGFIFYNPTACDVAFHKNLHLPKNTDMSLIGCGRHPRFPNKNERIDIISKLRIIFKTKTIKVYGRRWNTHSNNFSHIQGLEFLNVIGSSIIGLDIQAVHSPLAHRMFEYLACGTPIITRSRDEVFLHLENGKEVITYETKYDLISKLKYYMNHLDELADIAKAGYIRTRKEHDIKNRINHLEKVLKLK